MLKNNKTLLLILIGLGLYIVFVAYRPVMGPLIIGALMAYLLYPGVILLNSKTKLSHAQSSVIVFSLFSLILITIVSFTTPVLIKQFQLVESEFQKASLEIIRLQPDLEKILGLKIPLDEMILTLEAELELLLKPERLFRVVQSATANIIWVMIIFVTCFFLLKDWNRLKDWFYQLFPKKMQKEVILLHEEIKLVWQSYLRGQLLMMFLIGSLSAIGGLIVGLRGAVLLGLLAGGLAMIPNIGPAIATIVAGVIAWTVGSSYIDISNFWFAILVIAIYLLIQLLEGVWFQPRIMSRRMNLHPGVILIAVVSTISLLGALAGLIVVPVIASLWIIIKYISGRANLKSA